MLASGRTLAVAVFAALAVGQSALVAEHGATVALRPIDILLTTAPTLSAVARTSMMDEAAGIWRQHGFRLDWLSATAVRPVASNRLRVLIVQKRPASDNPSGNVAVGELVRPPKGHPTALISIESARQLIASVRGRAGYELIAIDERRLGILLGRALAHEIGHYVLNTHTHARSGLMRPNFDALEFTDMRDGGFTLDREAADWLRTRAVETFAYSRF